MEKWQKDVVKILNKIGSSLERIETWEKPGGLDGWDIEGLNELVAMLLQMHNAISPEHILEVADALDVEYGWEAKETYRWISEAILYPGEQTL